MAKQALWGYVSDEQARQRINSGNATLGDKLNALLKSQDSSKPAHGYVDAVNSGLVSDDNQPTEKYNNLIKQRQEQYSPQSLLNPVVNNVADSAGMVFNSLADYINRGNNLTEEQKKKAMAAGFAK